jgi:hypothetical protein
LQQDNSNGGPRINFLDVFNFLKHIPGQNVELGGAPRTWKLKGLETHEL